jgi:ABC-type molybdate transport system substrate-binding protein
MLALLLMSTGALGDDSAVRVRAAGSLRAAMTEIAELLTHRAVCARVRSRVLTDGAFRLANRR